MSNKTPNQTASFLRTLSTELAGTTVKQRSSLLGAANMIDRLRDWISETGDISDICTRHVLRETCQYCKCGRVDVPIPSEKLGVITRKEWTKRYAAQIRRLAGDEGAEDAAEAGADGYEQDEREAGNPVVWWGGPTNATHNTPEDEADEEMASWTDDGC